MTDTDRSFTSMLEDAQGSSTGQTRILVDRSEVCNVRDGDYG